MPIKARQLEKRPTTRQKPKGEYAKKLPEVRQAQTTEKVTPGSPEYFKSIEHYDNVARTQQELREFEKRKKKQ